MRQLLLSTVCVLSVLLVLTGCGESMPAPGTNDYTEAVTHFYTGIAAMEVGEDRRAEEHLLRVVELAPMEAAAWADLGLLALRRNELDVAVERLTEALDLAPRESRIHFLLGMVSVTRGNPQEAIEHFERASEFDPENVRAIYALAEQIETFRGPQASEEVRRLMDAILEIYPNNLAVLVERARLAAIAGDESALRETLDRLEEFAPSWSDEVYEQFVIVREALDAGNLGLATTELTFLSNVLKREPAYRETLAAVRSQTGQPTEILADLLVLPLPEEPPAPPDHAMSFEAADIFSNGPAGPWVWAGALALTPDSPPVVAAMTEAGLVLSGGSTLPSPGRVGAEGLIQTDYNYDFLVDIGLAGDAGFRLYRQDASGSFADVTGEVGIPAGVADVPFVAGWTADIDMEGDLDLILSRTDASPVVFRNNGDGSFSVQERFSDVTGARDFVWADLDSDGDPDAVFIDSAGQVHFYENNRSQGFAYEALDFQADAVVAADLNQNGRFEVVAFTADGRIVRHQRSVGTEPTETADVLRWDDAPPGEEARLMVADLDNNGAVDILTSRGAQAAVFLGGEDGAFARLEAPVQASIQATADVGGTGRLDLIGIGDRGQPVRLVSRGERTYASSSLRPLAADATGDQRINPFGLGGEVEVRASLLFQKQPITDPVLHFGLGNHGKVDVARIVWPNGDIQAEFDLTANESVEARQRLKGSCPWLFTYDGESMRFVTDFIWRSPLGLRINAQETAGVMMTEDWVKIDGDELKPRDGIYDLRITAELWESHFFDHVSLMVVDHPIGTEVFVDERFAFPPPALKVHLTTPPSPVRRVRDSAGRDVTALTTHEDERYLGAFERAQYQGLTDEHFIELDLRDAPSDRPLRLLASGWIRPTDSSINLAIGQHGSAQPRGLRLEVPDSSGKWKTVYPNLGFPAGKHKTIVIDLADVFSAEQIVRLSTNMEIYWDRFAWAEALPTSHLKINRLKADRADLAYRGYSVVTQRDRTHPEVPAYDSLASTGQIWQDLTGYYTRFGDVRELLDGVDDRYVIMNAGDELRFEFETPDEPEAGWTRDFVLVGDGWVKDGDYNTAFSETVLPLPSHDRPDYIGPRVALEDDPVYKRHPEDWRTFHTRYVTNDVLIRRQIP